MHNRFQSKFWVLLLALVTLWPVMAQAENPASAEKENQVEQQATETAVAEDPRAVVKVVNHEVEEPSMRSLIVVRDAETGELRAPTDEEWALVAPSVEPLNRSFSGLTETYYADGTVGVNLQGRYQSMMTAQQHEHGLEADCGHDVRNIAGQLIAPATAEEKAAKEENSDVR